jgi:exodeoxyribonuclease V alpha subunit
VDKIRNNLGPQQSESTGFQAHTIHRLLEVDPRNSQFKHNENAPLL